MHAKLSSARAKLAVPRTAVILAAAAATAATVALSVVPLAHFGFRSSPTHVAIETAAGVIALVAAYLVLGRYRRSALIGDLWLLIALAVLGLSSLCFSAIPAALDVDAGRFVSWAPLAGRLAGALLLAACSFAPERPVARPRRALLHAGIACTATLAAIGAGMLVWGPRLPATVDLTLSPATGSERIAGAIAVLLAQLLALAAFAVAAVGFARRAARTGDRLIGWFAVGSTLAAFASLNYALFPSLYSPYVYTGDLLRLGFYLALMIGAARELDAYNRELAGAAALSERHRVARELHDGLAQELVYIGLESERLAQRSSEAGALEGLRHAAQRALDESRALIAALSRTSDEPLDVALERTAEELSHRTGASVRVKLPSSVEVAPSAREALVRIMREGVTNAVRHAHASEINVELSNGRDVRLRISDNGLGFDPRTAPRGGFGLTSMRERARAAGGDLTLVSRPGAGTQIEVVLP